MPLVQAKCPNCGATLEVDNTKDAAICPYCQSAYVVEKAIINISGESSNKISADVVNVYANGEADYVVRAGKLERYNGSSTDVEIPANVTVIGEGAFKGCSALTKIVIPNTIKSIEDSAFEGCKCLEKFYLSDSVKSFGMGVFRDCPNIEVIFSDGITEIYDYMFSYSSFSSIKLPANITRIGKKAFIGNKALETVVLPDLVSRIEDDAFNDCFLLKNINMPLNLEYIGEAAFVMCQHITEIRLPKGFKEVGPRAFAGCCRLKTVVFPDGLYKIGDRAFYACSELSSTNVPSSASTGEDIFMSTGLFGGLNLSETARSEIDNLVRAGNKILAIKVLRDDTGIDLKSAKDIIDEYSIKMGSTTSMGAGTQTTQNKSGGCYIATCVYGTYDCPQVWTLRRYRDYFLAKSWLGRVFIKTYYAVSPSLVRWFGNTTWFKRIWKGFLDKKVLKLKKCGYSDFPYND